MSHLASLTPQETETDVADLKFPSIRLGDNIQHKLTIGSRLLISVFHISLQGEFEFLPKVNGGREVLVLWRQSLLSST